MAVLMLEGSTARYVGKDAAFLLRGRHLKVAKVAANTQTNSPTYPMVFEGEEAVVHVSYGSLDFIERKTKELNS